MKYLLDTNAFLWFLGADRRLGQTAKQMIESELSDCAFSIISIWEIVIKLRLGKLQLPGDIFNLLDEMQMTVLDLDQRHLKTLQQLETIVKDPFDQLLAAQSMAEKLLLVTADNVLLNRSTPGLKTYDSRI